ncbi:DUF222 domain-containing protein, partial [Paenarthrobacter sp. NPDC091669]|uniref:DUF222 domain-containing protein n=1 Tax=Paenarthrobacter sp. NPDC091669 TaxID=3364384 RepID=UPI0038160746
MGNNGQVLTRRAASPRAVDLLRQRSRRYMSVPARIASFRGTTAMFSSTDPSRDPDSWQGVDSLQAGPAGPHPPMDSAHGAPVLAAALPESAAAVDSMRSSAFSEARLFGFVEAADFAGKVEEIARSVEYLQVVAAQAVERTRTEALQAGPVSSAAAPELRTGWTEPATAATAPGAVSVLDDGYRNAAEFLRARLRIGIGEAKRRLALAPDVLPRTGMAGQEIPARREILAQAVGSALVPSRSASIISAALDKVRNLTDEDTLTRMEHALTTTAVETDPDFVTKIAKRWIDVIDHDGPEPTEEILRQLQGV